MFILPSPIQRLLIPEAEASGISVFVKRDDLIHPIMGGNKYRKLRYNIEEAQKKGLNTLVTFGGAFSNHIYATAATGKYFNFQTVGIIRGQELTPQSSETLLFAQKCGMKLFFAERSLYRNKQECLAYFMPQIEQPFCLIPEGGSNNLAVKGVAEMVQEIDFLPNYICVAAGTGGTSAGIIAGANTSSNIVSVAVLKGANFLLNEIKNLTPSSSLLNWQLITDYHFGGYAKHTPELLDFIADFQEKYHIPIEPIYTGKLFFAVIDLLKQRYFQENSSIVIVHTGGLR